MAGGLLEWYKRKLLMEKLTEDNLKTLLENKDRQTLQKIDRQTSTSSGIWQNIIGNVITDGAILLLRRLFR